MPDPRTFKDAAYAEFARVGHALSSPRRLEVLDLLTQRPHTVEQLAEATATPVKNTSAHLRVLRQAHLVDTRRDGTHIHYRLAHEAIVPLLLAVQALARSQLAEVNRLAGLYLEARDELEPITLKEVRRRLRDGDVTVLDVRPHAEFIAGHLPGATSIPVAELRRRLREIPPGREVVAYCRGRFCVFAVEAVTILRKAGFDARRSTEGMAEWRGAGWPVEVGA